MDSKKATSHTQTVQVGNQMVSFQAVPADEVSQANARIKEAIAPTVKRVRTNNVLAAQKASTIVLNA